MDVAGLIIKEIFVTPAKNVFFFFIFSRRSFLDLITKGITAAKLKLIKWAASVFLFSIFFFAIYFGV